MWWTRKTSVAECNEDVEQSMTNVVGTSLKQSEEKYVEGDAGLEIPRRYVVYFDDSCSRSFTPDTLCSFQTWPIRHLKRCESNVKRVARWLRRNVSRKQEGCPVTTSNAPHKHIRPIVQVHLKPHFHATRIVFMKSYLDFSHKLLSVPCCLVRCYALWKQIYYSIRRYVRIEQYTNDQCLLVYLIWMNMRNRTGNRSLKNAMALRGLLSEFEHHRSLNY